MTVLVSLQYERLQYVQYKRTYCTKYLCLSTSGISLSHLLINLYLKILSMSVVMKQSIHNSVQKKTLADLASIARLT